MDKGAASSTQEQHTSVVWSVCCDYKQLYSTLHDAVRQATHLGEPLLASFTQTIPVCDPIHLFAARHSGESSFFWEKPSEQRVLIGLGEVALIEALGANRFATVATHWQEILQHAVVYYAQQEQQDYRRNHTSGPLLFGGFAFDEYGAHSELWQGFPNSLFVLPHLLVSIHADYATLTINQFVQPGDDTGQHVKSIAAQVLQLRATVERTTVPPPARHSGTLSEQSDQNLLAPDDWIAVVEQTVHTIKQGKYKKVVLARGVKGVLDVAEDEFDSISTLQRLRHNYPDAFIFALQRGKRTFIGATPELLARVHNGHLKTMALAGSARRGLTTIDDERIGSELLSSKKDLEEHEFVVDMIREYLQAFCSSIMTTLDPQLLKLKNVQHLVTHISAEMQLGRTILDVIAELHPTPAVGGLPRPAALALIRSHEQLDRGWYAGPIGWLGAHGGGEFAVALRCALLESHAAVLFAGCGIVADSDPQREYEESRLKLRAMIQGLCGTDNTD